jgi:hypothetical protein
MNAKLDRRAVLMAGVVTLFVAFYSAYAQTITTNTVPDGGKIVELYLAKDDGNGAEGERAENFELADIPIYCIVKLNAPGGTNVKMILLAATVPGIKAGSKIVTTSYTLKDREDQVTFYGQPTDKWLPGKYKVELFLDNKLERTLNFNIGDADAAIKAAASKRTPSPTKPVPATTKFQSPKSKSPKP